MKPTLGLLALSAIVVISVPADEHKPTAIAAADERELVVITALGGRNETASVAGLTGWHKRAVIVARGEGEEEDEEGPEDYTLEEDEEYYNEEEEEAEDYTLEEDEEYYEEEDEKGGEGDGRDKYPMPAFISNLKLHIGETPGNKDHAPSLWEFDVDVHPSVQTTHCRAYRLNEKTYHYVSTKRAAPVQWQFCDDHRVAFSVDKGRRLSVWWDSDRPDWGLVHSLHRLNLTTRKGEVWSDNETERNLFETYKGPDFGMSRAIYPGDNPKQGWKLKF